MTDRKQALEALLAKVEAGVLPEAVFHGSSVIRGHWAYTMEFTADQRTKIFLAYNGSLDAALALHEAVLPGWEYVITSDTVDVWMPSNSGMLCDLSVCQGEIPDKPARAWLIAILRALIAQETVE